MKLIALITDSLREIYAKKVIIGIVIIEALVLIFTSLFLFSGGAQRGFREAGTISPADSSIAESQSRRDEPIDTSLLSGDTLPSDTIKHNAQQRSSHTFEFELGGNRGKAGKDAKGVIVEEMVKGEMGAFAVPIALATIFFGIFILAGIVPSLMEKGTIDLLLSKPLSRTTILLGRALGGFIAIAVNLLIFLLALFTLYGVASGVWVFSFVIFGFAIPMFTLIVIYGAIVLLNVITEGSVLPMILAYLHLMVLATVLYSREQLLYSVISSSALQAVIDGLYYALPQTSDLLGTVPLGIYGGAIGHATPFVQGVIFAAVTYTLALWKFQRKDF